MHTLPPLTPNLSNLCSIVLQNLEEEERATIIGGAWDGVLGKTTWSRYLVENYFSKMRWYYPNRDK